MSSSPTAAQVLWATTWRAVRAYSARRGGQLGDRGCDRAPVMWRDEGAGLARRDQVERTAGRWGHHRHPAGQRLLHGLAEGLVRSSVDEDVEAGVDAGQLRAVPRTQEERAR